MAAIRQVLPVASGLAAISPRVPPFARVAFTGVVASGPGVAT